MKLHDLIQGTPEWLAYRAQHRNASDAAAMLGISPHKSRSQLLHDTWTGLQKEFSDYQQTRVLDPGHAFEAHALPLANEIVGEQLFPVVGSREDSNLSASFDGLTFAETLHFEHKRLSSELRERMPNRGENENVTLPRYHYVQVQQQFMCAEKSEACLFMASEWTDEGKLIDERHCWVYPDATEQAVIEAGWRQFEADLAAYSPPTAEPAKLVGAVRESLPALRVLVEGKVMETNLDTWAEAVRARIRSVNITLLTDQDFADAESDVKWCSDAEDRLEQAKQHALSQTESIEKLFRVMDSLKEETRQRRLTLKPLIYRRKTERKTELVSESLADFHAFIAEQNAGLSPYRLPAGAVDFAGVIKGKRSFSSMKDALDTELARAKIEATNVANAMRVNIRAFADVHDFSFLFNDAASLILKDSEAVSAIIAGRIATHQAEQKRKAEEAAEAEREKIRAEERARAQAEEAARAQAEREAQAARDREAARVAAEVQAKADAEAKAEADRLAQQQAEADAQERRSQDEARQRERAQAEADLQKLGQAGAPVASAVAESIVSSSLEGYEDAAGFKNGSVGQMIDQTGGGSHYVPHDPLAFPGFPGAGKSSRPAVASELAQEEHAWINLGKMAEALGFRLDAEFVTETLGVPFSRTEKTARFWTPTQFEAIKRKLAAHVLDATAFPF